MRPKGTPAELERRRTMALKLRAEGLTQAKVAEIVGASRQTVSEWEKKKRTGKLRPYKQSKGRKPDLGAREVRQLERILDKGAYAYGFSSAHWTLDRIAKVVFDTFGRRYTESGVWHILNRMGWSCQRPQRVAAERDEATISTWKRVVFARAQKSGSA